METLSWQNRTACKVNFNMCQWVNNMTQNLKKTNKQTNKISNIILYPKNIMVVNTCGNITPHPVLQLLYLFQLKSQEKILSGQEVWQINVVVFFKYINIICDSRG